MYSFERPDDFSLSDPSGFIVISLALLVLNSEYSFVANNGVAFNSKERIQPENKTRNALTNTLISFFL